MMVTCIVEYDVNYTHRGVGFLNLFQHFPGGYSIDLFALDEDKLGSFKIKCALNVDPLATRRGFNRRLLILREPAMSRTALILRVQASANRIVSSSPNSLRNALYQTINFRCASSSAWVESLTGFLYAKPSRLTSLAAHEAL